MEKQAKYTGDRLMAAINAFRNSHLTKTKTVLLFDDISKMPLTDIKGFMLMSDRMNCPFWR